MENITLKDVSLIWDLIHYHHIGKIPLKVAEERLANYLNYLKTKYKKVKTTNISDFQNLRKEISVLNGGTKDKKPSPQKQQKQKQKQKPSKESKKERLFTKDEMREMMSEFKQEMMGHMGAMILEGVERTQDSIEKNVVNEMEIKFERTQRTIKKVDMKVEEVKNMMISEASFWDLSWRDTYPWLKSQFREGIIAGLKAPFKLTAKAIYGGVYHTTIGPVTYCTKQLTKSGAVIFYWFMFGAIVLGAVNVMYNSQSYQLPEGNIEVSGNQMCINPGFGDYEFLDLNNQCLKEQFTDKTQFQYFVTDNLPTGYEKYLDASTELAYNLFQQGKKLTFDQYTTAFTKTIPKNFPGAMQVYNKGAGYVNYFLFDIGKTALNQFTSAVSSLGSIVSKLGSLTKVTSSISLNPFKWFGGGGKRKRKNKMKKKGRKIRKHSGVNQDTGRLKKGYKYSGKKLKNGLPQIIKIKK